MTIAVYTDFKFYRSRHPDLYFIKNLLESFSIYHPQHQYYLLSPHSIDQFVAQHPTFTKNDIRTSPGLFYNYRLNAKVSRTLEKIKADVVFSIDAFFKTKTPQMVLLTHLTKTLEKRKLGKAKSILVLSQNIKTELIAKYKLDPRSILLLPGGAGKLFEPIDEEMKSIIKERHTDGKEFFVYRGRIKEENNIIKLLKGFSLFKKRQKSSMKFLLMGQVFWQGGDFKKLIDTYKYKDDLVFVTDEVLAEEANILATAYATVQPYEANNSFIFDAMQCGVPVLSLQSPDLKEIVADGAIFFDNDEAAIADKMMLVYKDEALRSRLIETGKEVCNTYSWKKTVDMVAEAFTNGK